MSVAITSRGRLINRTWKSRIRACVLGREQIYGGSDIVIIARTDALASEGFDGAMERVSNTHMSRY